MKINFKMKHWKPYIIKPVGDCIRAWMDITNKRELSVEKMDYKPKYFVLYYYEEEKNDKYLKNTMNAEILLQDATRLQALKFAKQYMRTH